MTDADRPFLNAILAAPDDDAPRLVYADFLDERGEGERAEFIRLAVAHRREWPDHDYPPHYEDYRESCRRLFEAGDRLIRAMGWKRVNGGLIWHFDCDGMYFQCPRGLVEFVSSPAVNFLRHADAITATHPVRQVRLETWPPENWVRRQYRKYGAKRGEVTLADLMSRWWKGIEFCTPNMALRLHNFLIEARRNIRASVEGSEVVIGTAARYAHLPEQGRRRSRP